MSYFAVVFEIALALVCFFIAKMYWTDFGCSRLWKTLSCCMVVAGFTAAGFAGAMLWLP